MRDGLRGQEQRICMSTFCTGLTLTPGDWEIHVTGGVGYLTRQTDGRTLPRYPGSSNGG